MSRIGRRPIDVPGNVEIVIGEENQVLIQAVNNFKSVTGKGVSGTINGKVILLGNMKLMMHHETSGSATN